MAAVQEGVNFPTKQLEINMLAPKEILIRSDLHGTTNIKGDVSKIPRVGMAPLLSKARTSSCANTTLRHTGTPAVKRNISSKKRRTLQRRQTILHEAGQKRKKLFGHP
ncbi:hypothetical protein AFLA70_49g004270 [Aspergillus flavus AF70]|nr:hypothetical protein AFLA70_49g004270 [Aspergillus flavus AF70]